MLMILSQGRANSFNIRHYFWVFWLGLTLNQMSQQAFLSDKMLTWCQTWKLPQTRLTRCQEKGVSGLQSHRTCYFAVERTQ